MASRSIIAIGRRTLAALFAVTAALLVIAWVFAPKDAEIAAMRTRGSVERAQLLMGRGDHAGAELELKRAIQYGGETKSVLEALLRLYETTGDTAAHSDLMFGRSGRAVSNEALRGAASFYARKHLPALQLQALDALISRDAATPSETLAALEAHIRSDPKGGLLAARRMAKSLNRGAEVGAVVLVARGLADAGDPPAAAQFLRQWAAASTPISQVMAAAPALIESGHPDLAVVTLEARSHETPEARRAHRYAMQRSGGQSPEARRALTQLALADLRRAGTSDAAQSALRECFEFGDKAVVANEVMRSGVWRRPALRALFVHQMLDAGRGAELAKVLIADYRGSSNEAVRGQIIGELVTLGALDAAEALLRDDAARAGPASTAYKQLLYVWRKRRGSIDQGWMSQRVYQGGDESAVVWARALAQEASPRAAAQALAQRKGETARIAIEVARHLAAANDYVQLRRTVQAAARYPLRPDEAAVLARYACAADDAATAAKLSSNAAGTSRETRECIQRHQLGAARTILAGSDLDAALNAFAKIDPRTITPQDHFDLALRLSDAGRAAQSRVQYEAVLSKLPEDSLLTQRQRTLKVETLVRLNRSGDAEGLLRRTLARNPRDKLARAALAELYLARGDDAAALSIAGL